jgi:hypothetical protein
MGDKLSSECARGTSLGAAIAGLAAMINARETAAAFTSAAAQLAPASTCRGEIHVRVDAQGYHPFGMLKVIAEPPPLRTPGHHMKTHAVLVRENVTVLARSCDTHNPRGE